jgi:hypothetical protein
MKTYLKTLLFVAVFLTPAIGYSQVAELGVSGGLSLHTGAFGNIYYKAAKMGSSPTASLTFLVNTNRMSESRLTNQVGFNVYYTFKLQNETGKTYIYFYESIGNDGKPFRYANYVLSFSPMVNWKYRLSDVSYVYGGVSAGIAGSRNVSNHKGMDFIGTDVTYKAPDGGLGYCAGIQGGWTQRLTQRIALNADIAVRYYNLSFAVNDKNYPGGTKFSYGTVVIPVTVGIRYRMGWPKELNHGNGRRRIIKEEIHKKGEKETE